MYMRYWSLPNSLMTEIQDIAMWDRRVSTDLRSGRMCNKSVSLDKQ